MTATTYSLRRAAEAWRPTHPGVTEDMTLAADEIDSLHAQRANLHGEIDSCIDEVTQLKNRLAHVRSVLSSDLEPRLKVTALTLYLDELWADEAKS